MPSKIVRVKRRRNYRRKKRMMKSRFTRNPSIGAYGLPKSLTTKLNYCLFLNQSTGTNNPCSRIFILNNIYRPDEAGSGGPTPALSSRQPFMRDQLSQFYDKYVVYGVKFKIQCSTDSTYDILTTWRSSLVSATLGDMALEFERGAYKILWSTEKPAVIKGYYNLASQFGIKKRQLMTDDTYQTTVGSSSLSSPIRKIFGILGTQAADTTTVVSVNYKVQLTFYIKFLLYQDQPAS